MKLKKAELQDMFLFLSRGLSQTTKDSILAKTGRGGQSASRDYISANCLLAEYRKLNPDLDYLPDTLTKEDLVNVLHPATRFRWQSYTPMLAERYDSLKPAQQEELFTSPNCVFTSKENGVRVWVIVYNGEVKCFSRNYSDVDCSLQEYWCNIAQEVHDFPKGVFAFDAEIKFEPDADISNDLEELGLTTDSPLESIVALLHTYPHAAQNIQNKFKAKYGNDLVVFRLIAPLYFKGKNYLKRSLGEGMEVYDECVKFGQSIGINIKPIARCNASKEEKKVFLNSIIANGHEGVVVHFKNSPYITSENRSKTGFIKIKRSVGNSMQEQGLGDTIDGWISGFKVGSNGTANEGMISAFEISCYIQSNNSTYEHVIAVVPNISQEIQRAATVQNATGMWPQEVTLSDGSLITVSLNPAFAYKTVEVDGQYVSRVSRRLAHPRFLRFRPDKSKEMCIYLQEFIDAQIKNNL